MTTHAGLRSTAISLRARPAQRALLDRACRYTHRTLTEFVHVAACREAEQVICDQRYFALESDAYDAFVAALDAPLADNPAVLKLLAHKAPWEE